MVFSSLNLKLNYNKDFIIFKSRGDKTYKYSYHIIIDNYYHKNNEEAKAFLIWLLIIFQRIIEIKL